MAGLRFLIRSRHLQASAATSMDRGGTMEFSGDQKVEWRRSSSCRDDEDVEDEGDWPVTSRRSSCFLQSSSSSTSSTISFCSSRTSNQSDPRHFLSVCLSVWLWNWVCPDQVCVSAPVRLHSSAAGQDLQQHLKHTTDRLIRKASFAPFTSVCSMTTRGRQRGHNKGSLAWF